MVEWVVLQYCSFKNSATKMSPFEVAKKRLSSPSIKLDKLHKDYPKSAATRSCSNGKVTPNEDPETQGHDLRDSDTFGKIVSTFFQKCKSAANCFVVNVIKG